MSVIARDTVASDHLVYAWPFPIGSDEYEVACAEDEQVVICPSWVVGGLFGPGRHRYRSPNPTQPTAAYFVLTAPVEVSFDFATMFQLPQNGAAVRVRAVGSLQIRCSDPSLLIAQFVGLPFDHLNEGVLRSVARSTERMLARLLTRRVVMAGTPAAVTDPQMLGAIVEELVAYNPAAGGVFGVQLVRVGHLAIAADDGRGHIDQMFPPPQRTTPPPQPARMPENGERTQPLQAMSMPVRPSPMPRTTDDGAVASGEISTGPFHRNGPRTPEDGAVASGEIGGAPDPTPSPPPVAAAPPPPPPPPPPSPRRAPTKPPPVETSEEATEPNSQPVAAAPAPNGKSEPPAILGIGTGHIGSEKAPAAGTPAPAPKPQLAPKPILKAGERMAPGARVLVPGPGGLMQSAIVRQLLQGYYELEVGGSDETIWVPESGVVPEP